jgi:hypothetical protein
MSIKMRFGALINCKISMFLIGQLLMRMLIKDGYQIYVITFGMLSMNLSLQHKKINLLQSDSLICSRKLFHLGPPFASKYKIFLLSSFYFLSLWITFVFLLGVIDLSFMKFNSLKS